MLGIFITVLAAGGIVFFAYGAYAILNGTKNKIRNKDKEIRKKLGFD